MIENLKLLTTKHIAIDGKASRGCYKIKGQCLLHVVSAWDTDNGIALGQLATKNEEGKDVGEYNTIPKLIEQLDIKGAVVTIDAAGCYTEITDAVVDYNGKFSCVSPGGKEGGELFSLSMGDLESWLVCPLLNKKIPQEKRMLGKCLK